MPTKVHQLKVVPKAMDIPGTSLVAWVDQVEQVERKVPGNQDMVGLDSSDQYLDMMA